MVDKKTPDKKDSTKKVDKKPTEKKETRAETFLRIAERRAEAVKNALRLLSNCSNKANYEYTSDQVDSMFDMISEAYSNALAKFSSVVSERKPFKFSK